jgi:hypothetical protein
MIERYIRHELAPGERRAFQEHYFECEECFEQVQMTARLIAGVRLAARKELLAPSAAEPAAWWASLFRPAFGLAIAGALALGFGWLMLRQSSAPPQELARGQQPSLSPGQPDTPAPSAAQSASPAPSSTERPKPTDEPDLIAQNRPPVVLLESSRDAGPSSNQLTLPANASRAILQIEVEPGSPFASFQFQVFDGARRLVATVISGQASARGAVAASLPTQELRSGKYLVKCYGVRDGQRELIGEYDLHVRKL